MYKKNKTIEAGREEIPPHVVLELKSEIMKMISSLNCFDSCSSENGCSKKVMRV